MLVQCQFQSEAVWRLTLAPSPGSEQILIEPEGVKLLAEHLQRAAGSPACRVMILEGQAGDFCQGMDLSTLTANDEEPPLVAEVQAFARCLCQLRDLSQIVVALVDGAVTGGGMGLAAAADCVIASSRATFALPELVLGLVPAVVMPLLMERLSPQQLRRLAFSGALEAQRAFEIGLVDRLVADAAEVTRACQGEIKHALRRDPQAVAAFKAFGRRIRRLSCDEATALGAELSAERFADPHTRNCIRAFLDGEPPPWFARPPQLRRT